jgi:L-ascorbate metabolism protein UlaG (beta-lactamase superfamily)
MTVQYGAVSIEWLGYATARVETDDGPVVYTDPGRYGVLDDYWARDGDLVVVTHDHHYDPAGVRSVAAPDATILVSAAVDPAGIDRPVDGVDSLAADYDVVRVDDAARVDVETPDGPVTVWTVAAHNDPAGPCADADGSVPHPPGSGCGFLLSFGDHTVFWPGDGDALEAYAELEVDVFLANIGGGGLVADRRAAAALAGRMTPGIVVPIHYEPAEAETVERLAADGEAFAADVASRSIPVALDEPSP